MVGIILHLCKPQKYSFLQSITSVEMYRSGCNQKVFNNVLLVLCLLLQFIKSYLYKSNENKCGLQILRWFQKLGLCKGVKVSREHAFLWINFAANMTATSNHGKMTFRYKPLNKLYGSRKKGDSGIFNNFKITL